MCVGNAQTTGFISAPSLSPDSPSLSSGLCSAYRACEAALPSPHNPLNYCQPVACLYCAAKRATPHKDREREREGLLMGLLGDSNGKIRGKERREEGRMMNRCVVSYSSHCIALNVRGGKNILLHLW